MKRSAGKFCPEFLHPSCAGVHAALAGVVCSMAVHAAPVVDTPALEEIQVTATRQRIATHDVSQGVTVIGPQDLRRHTPLTVVDHLRGEPGTYVQQTTPGQGIPIIRGLKGSEVLHLVDGFRLNNAIFRNAPNQYIALVNPWNVERIEAVRGPVSAFHGGEAMGGVVQFFTRTPRFEGNELLSRGKAGLQLGSADSRLSSQLEGEVGTERWVMHAGASWQDVDELRVGGGDTLPHTDFRSHGAHASVAWRLADDQKLILQAQFMEQPRTARFDALVPGFGQTQPDFSEHSFQPQQRQFAQARWISERRTALWDSADVQIGAQRIVDDRATRDYEAPFRELERNSSTLLGAVGQFSREIAATHSLSAGFEIYHDTVDSSRRRITLADDTIAARASRFPDGSTMRWIGVHVADRWSPLDRLNVTAGARYTRYDIELPPSINDIGVRMQPDDVSASVGLVFHATDSLNVVANAGRGFRPPNVFDLGTFGARGNRFSIPNADLSPEYVLTYDAGLKFESGNVRAELMAFRSDYRDKITQVVTGEVDASGRLIVQSRNATRLELRGIEAGALWNLDSRVELYATVTWTRGEETLEAATYAADRVPPLFGRVAAKLRLGERWVIEPSIYWADRQDRLSPRDRVDPRMNPLGTAGWVTAGLRADWQFSESLAVFFGVENLTDQRYREHGSGFDAPGRNAFASLEWSF